MIVINSPIKDSKWLALQNQSTPVGIVTIKIEEIDRIALSEAEITCDGFLKQYLSDKSSDTFKQVCEELQAYYKDEGGSPVVSEFEIVSQDCSFDTGSGRGKIRLKYAVRYHFGCSDLCPVTDIAETCDFTINKENSTLSVFIPDKIERSTIDEF